MTMRSFSLMLALMLLLAATTLSSAFQPVTPGAGAQTTALSMGLFDGFKPKPKEPKPQGGGAPDKKNMDVFAGRGKRITVREDEDNDMWIEEDSKGKRKNIWGK